MTTLLKRGVGFILTQSRVAMPVHWMMQAQCSTVKPVSWIGKAGMALLRHLLKQRYYKLLYFAQHHYKKTLPLTPARFLIGIAVVQKIDALSEYIEVLKILTCSPIEQHVWAHCFLEMGRRDLAFLGWSEVLKDAALAADLRLHVYDAMGWVCYFLGKSKETNYYWGHLGQLRRALFTPTTPRAYRILGKSWYGSIGHIAFLDYYVKYLKLYGEDEVRVVARWPSEQLPGQALLKKFTSVGVTLLSADEQALEEDYNRWADQHGYCRWQALSAMEKVALVDEHWRYDFFPEGTLVYHHALSRIQQAWESQKRPPLFTLSEAEKSWVTAYLSHFNMPPDAWYVCVHVREPGNPIHQKIDAIYPTTRDAQIHDYQLAIETIVEAGGWVLRMGDPSMTPLPPMDHVIDYAHSPFRTQEADILLSAGCRFVVGTASGYLGFPMIYHVPCMVTNVATLGWPLWPSKDLMLPKLLREKATGRYLSLAQVFERGLACLHYQQDIPDELELVDNTPEELAEGVKEMLRYCEDPSQFGVTVGVPEAIQQYYHQVATSYGGYTGNRLARSFVNKHAEVFAVPQSIIVPSSLRADRRSNPDPIWVASPIGSQ